MSMLINNLTHSNIFNTTANYIQSSGASSFMDGTTQLVSKVFKSFLLLGTLNQVMAASAGWILEVSCMAVCTAAAFLPVTAPLYISCMATCPAFGFFGP